MTSPSTGAGAGLFRMHPDGTASRASRVLGIVVLVGLALFLALALLISEPDRSLDAQGEAVRIMYLHVPAAITCYTAFLITAVASAMYLWKRTAGWDALAAASVEVGVIFTAITLVTGSIWGHFSWGTYWEWDPRLTSTSLMFVMYLGYIALRRAIIDPASRAKQSAILGLVAFINVPIVHYSVDWWRSLHQTATVATLDPKIDGTRLLALMFGMVVFLAIFVWMMIHRFRVEYAEAAVEARSLEVALAERRAEAQADQPDLNQPEEVR